MALAPELADLIRRKVDAGEYRNADDVERQALELLDLAPSFAMKTSFGHFSTTCETARRDRRRQARPSRNRASHPADAGGGSSDAVQRRADQELRRADDAPRSGAPTG
jgi:hypothetical protein